MSVAALNGADWSGGHTRRRDVSALIFVGTRTHAHAQGATPVYRHGFGKFHGKGGSTNGRIAVAPPLLPFGVVVSGG